MSVMEIFEKSQESLELKEQISSSSIAISCLLVENYFDFIHISIAKEDKDFSGWIIRDSDELDEDEDYENMVIGDTVFLNPEDEGDQLTLFHENRFTGAISLLKSLFEIFTGPILDATFLTGTLPTPEISKFIIDAFHLNRLKKCEKVMLYDNQEGSTRQVDEVLELATGLKFLDLRCPLPDEWSNPRVLQVEKLRAWPAEWFTKTDLLENLNCKVAQINETNLDCHAFTEFMLKWQASDDRRLKMLEISFDGDWEEFNTRGLEVEEWNKQERDSHFPDLLGKPTDPWFNCEFASDIRRKDGLLASFWRRENSFHFVVWHDLHPIVTLNPSPEQLVKLEDLEFLGDEEEEEEEDEE
ncbi:hypothetical protein CRE_08176 [Caenorhabditis remanei]|uniref:F-box associated domain-containing protein n=1 Tax=Caenorhabditis remanei TaxID=31234 RepID=E3M3U7_CAERE|nr:hypothetical protein CRE_08176 [Caenorhabditis remanei]